MKVDITNQPVNQQSADAIVVTVGKQGWSASAQEVDRACGGKLTELREQGEISTETLALTQLSGLEGLQSSVLLVVGTGDKAIDSPGLAYQVAGAAAKHLATRQRSSVAFFLDDLFSADAVAAAIAGCHGQDMYRAKKALFPFEQILFATDNAADLQRGIVLGDSMNTTRRLVNEPANKIYPISFAAECEALGKQAGFAVEVWDEKKLEQENCGSMLAVAQASTNLPRLVIMRYKGGTGDNWPLALVGKGVTFDSGGLSLKPSESMLDMKCDMAGAGTVVGAMQAIASLKLPVNVIGLVGLAENMIAGNAYRLGDVLTARSGKTIEVHNTDAEGRLVLADVLNVAVQNGAEKIVDLATLTGACMVALGKYTTGVMTNDQKFCDQVLQAANELGEKAWQLPMFPEFAEDIKSEVADIKNVGDGRWGGAITAGKFLEEFVEDTTWVHLDIAGPSFLSAPKPWIDAGASGCFVRTLVRVAESCC